MWWRSRRTGMPVVDEHAHLLEHLPDPFDTDRQRTQRREDLGVVHLVARGVPGQDDDQCPADIEPRSPSPAAGLASTVGQVDRPGQPWVAQVGVVALVEPGEVSAGFEQSRRRVDPARTCLLYTSDAADDLLCVDL